MSEQSTGSETSTMLPCPFCDESHEAAQVFEHQLGCAESVRVSCECGVCGPWEEDMDAAETSWNELPRTTPAMSEELALKIDALLTKWEERRNSIEAERFDPDNESNRDFLLGEWGELGEAIRELRAINIRPERKETNERTSK